MNGLYKMTYQEHNEWGDKTGKPEIIYAYLNDEQVGLINNAINRDLKTFENYRFKKIISVEDYDYIITDITSIEHYQFKTITDFASMEAVINKFVKHYKTDFYDYDMKTLSYPKEDNFLWVVRDSGTWLIPESEIHNSSIVEHCLNNRNSYRYYKVNANDLQPHQIKNIEKYVAECKEQANVVKEDKDEPDFDI